MWWVTKMLQLSAPALAPALLLNFRTNCGPTVRKMAHTRFKPTTNSDSTGNVSWGPTIIVVSNEVEPANKKKRLLWERTALADTPVAARSPPPIAVKDLIVGRRFNKGAFGALTRCGWIAALMSWKTEGQSGERAERSSPTNSRL